MPIALGLLTIYTAVANKRAQTAREAQKQATENAEHAITQKLDEQNRAREKAAREVKEKLAVAAAETLLKLEVIRIEGNSKMGSQKKATMEAWQVAAKLSKDPEHEAKARHAEKAYLDHCAAEKLADDRVLLFVEQERLKLLYGHPGIPPGSHPDDPAAIPAP